ncbi:MAG: hypothetical protein H6868_08550 [Rhodospirillales bacterium]|nr:hypothetical protein [Rhodospirillales bacterium]
MRFAVLFAAVLTVLVTGFSQESRADYNVWEDVKTGLSLTYPDTWRRLNNQQPDDLLTIAPDAGRAHAQCRVRANDDRRHAIYPSRYDPAIQQIDFSRGFWEQYLAQYEDISVIDFHEVAGLGRGHGSFVRADYTAPAPDGAIMPRRMMAFVSYYDNRSYILECSSHAEAFDDWQKLFLSVAGSVDFKKTRYEMKSGNHGRFISDGGMRFETLDEKYSVTY